MPRLAAIQGRAAAVGFRMAWVGYAHNDADQTLRPMAWAGAEQGYLSQLRFTWDDSRHGQGPAGRTVRFGQPSVVNDVASDASFIPWREAALTRGYHSLAGFPLRHEGQVLGVLLIYAAAPNAFGEAEVDLLQELAWHVSFGIAALRTQAAEEQRRAELELQHQQQQILKNILNIALEPIALENKLDCSLRQLADLPWFSATQGTALFLRDPASDQLYLAASYRMPAAVHEGCAKVPLGSCFCGRVAQSGQPEYARQTLPSHNHRNHGECDHGHFSLPLPGTGSSPLGVLTLHLDPHHSYSEAEDQFLATAAANYLTLAEDRLARPGADPEGAGELVGEGQSQVRRVSDIVRNIRCFLGYGQPRLTPRQQEVARYLAAGRSAKEAARELGLSPKTVEVHRGHILEKMGAATTVELVHLLQHVDIELPER